jgi:hypothetical protein
MPAGSRATDVAQPFHLRNFWGLSGSALLTKYSAPNEATNDDNHAGTHLMKQEDWNGRPVQLWKAIDDGTFKIFAPSHAGQMALRVTLFNHDLLEKYFDLAWGKITWTQIAT